MLSPVSASKTAVLYKRVVAFCLPTTSERRRANEMAIRCGAHLNDFLGNNCFLAIAELLPLFAIPTTFVGRISLFWETRSLYCPIRGKLSGSWGSLCCLCSPIYGDFERTSDPRRAFWACRISNKLSSISRWGSAASLLPTGRREHAQCSLYCGWPFTSAGCTPRLGPCTGCSHSVNGPNLRVEWEITHVVNFHGLRKGIDVYFYPMDNNIRYSIVRIRPLVSGNQNLLHCRQWWPWLMQRTLPKGQPFLKALNVSRAKWCVF